MSFFAEKYLKIPVCWLLIISLLLQSIPLTASAFGIGGVVSGIKGAISKIGGFFKKIYEKITLSLPGEFILTEEADLKLGRWKLAECVYKKDINGDGEKECINPYSTMRLGSDTVPLTNEQGNPAVVIPTIPEVCRLRIPPEGGTGLSPEQRIALRKACSALISLQEAAAREVYYSKYLFNATDPLSSCFFLRNCKTECTLKMGDITYTIDLVQVLSYFAPYAGQLKMLKDIAEAVRLVTSVVKMIKTTRQLTVLIGDIRNLINNLFASVVYLKTFYISMRNIIDITEDVATGGWGGFKGVLTRFTDNLTKFSSAKANAIRRTQNLQSHISVLISDVQSTEGVKWLFDAPSLSSKRQELDRIVSNFLFKFEKRDDVLKSVEIMMKNRIPKNPRHFNDVQEVIEESLSPEILAETPTLQGRYSYAKECDFPSDTQSEDSLKYSCVFTYEIPQTTWIDNILWANDEWNEIVKSVAQIPYEAKNQDDAIQRIQEATSSIINFLNRIETFSGSGLGTPLFREIEIKITKEVESPAKWGWEKVNGVITRWYVDTTTTIEIYKGEPKEPIDSKEKIASEINSELLTLDRTIDKNNYLTYTVPEQMETDEINKAIEMLNEDPENPLVDEYNLFNPAVLSVSGKTWKNLDALNQKVAQDIKDQAEIYNLSTTDYINYIASLWQEDVKPAIEAKDLVKKAVGDWGISQDTAENTPLTILRLIKIDKELQSIEKALWEISYLQACCTMESSPPSPLLPPPPGKQKNKGGSTYHPHKNNNSNLPSFNSLSSYLSNPAITLTTENYTLDYATPLIKEIRNIANNLIAVINIWQEDESTPLYINWTEWWKGYYSTPNCPSGWTNLCKTTPPTKNPPDYPNRFPSSASDITVYSPFQKYTLGSLRFFAERPLESLPEREEEEERSPERIYIENIISTRHYLESTINSINNLTKTGGLIEKLQSQLNNLKNKPAGQWQDRLGTLEQSLTTLDDTTDRLTELKKIIGSSDCPDSKNPNQGILNQLKCFEKKNKKTFEEIKIFLIFIEKLEKAKEDLNNTTRSIAKIEPSLQIQPMRLAPDINLSDALQGKIPLRWQGEGVENFDEFKQKLTTTPYSFVEGLIGDALSSLDNAESSYTDALQYLDDNKPPLLEEFDSPLRNISEKFSALRLNISSNNQILEICKNLSLILQTDPETIKSGCENIDSIVGEASIALDNFRAANRSILNSCQIANNIEKTLQKAFEKKPSWLIEVLRIASLNPNQQDGIIQRIIDNNPSLLTWLIDHTEDITQYTGIDFTSQPDAWWRNNICSEDLYLLDISPHLRCDDLASAFSENLDLWQSGAGANPQTCAQIKNKEKELSDNLIKLKDIQTECRTFSFIEKMFQDNCSNISRQECEAFLYSQGKEIGECSTNKTGVCENLKTNFNNNFTAFAGKDLTDKENLEDLQSVRRICALQSNDIRTPLEEIMKIFSLLLGVKSGTLGWSAIKGSRESAQKVYEDAQKLITLIKESAQEVPSWNIGKAEGGGLKVESLKCESNPAVGYKGRRGPKGGPVCPDVDKIFSVVESYFNTVRQKALYIKLVKKRKDKVSIGGFDIPWLKTFVDVYKFPEIDSVQQRAESIKEKAMYLWAVATLINYANKNCTCGQSYCKLPLCISGIPLTPDPIHNPFCLLVYGFRWPMKEIGEWLERDLTSQ